MGSFINSHWHPYLINQGISSFFVILHVFTSIATDIVIEALAVALWSFLLFRILEAFHLTNLFQRNVDD